MHNGFQDLINAIEKLTGKTFPKVDKENIDLAKMRREEAHLASLEIAEKRRKNHKHEINEMYLQSIINPNWTFEKIQIDSLNSKAIEIAKSFCSLLNIPNNYIADTNPALLLIQGSPGCGKTVLCNCVANKFLNEHYKEVQICPFNVIKRSRAPGYKDTAYDAEEKMSSWEKYLHTDLLIIDGLCQDNENLTAFDKQVFVELLRTRHKLGLPIVITTTLPIANISTNIGEACIESIKDYSVFASALLGLSRRQAIVFN